MKWQSLGFALPLLHPLSAPRGFCWLAVALIRRSLIDQQLELPALLCRPKTRLLAYSGDPRPPTLDWQSVTSPRSGASAERRLGGDSPMCHHTSISRVPS